MILDPAAGNSILAEAEEEGNCYANYFYAASSWAEILVKNSTPASSVRQETSADRSTHTTRAGIICLRLAIAWPLSLKPTWMLKSLPGRTGIEDGSSMRNPIALTSCVCPPKYRDTVGSNTFTGRFC